MNLTLDDLLKASGGRLITDPGDVNFSRIVTDTRILQSGDLYLPLKGPHFDGHDFLTEAASRGAVGALVARDEISIPAGLWAVQVEDTLAAYGDLARYWREKLGLKVVAVTGSSGKTSTKEMIASLLSRYFRVAKSHANYNNEIGVPLTLLSLKEEEEVCILEMGMRGPGEIAYLASVARPNFGLVTNIGTAHIGRLGTQEAIAKAKGELFRVGGPAMTAILNLDDPLIMAQGHDHPGPVVTYSLRDPHATVWAEGKGKTFSIHWKAGERMKEGSTHLTLPQAGQHHRANALAAFSVAWAMGCALPETMSLRSEDLPGRSRVLRVGDIELVDETYNANPESVRATLSGFLGEDWPGRRIAVLGEMKELGTYAEVAHRGIGTMVAESTLAKVFTVGPMARWIAEQAAFKAEHVPDNAHALEALISFLQPGDRVFLKGSRSAKMEEIVNGLCKHYGGTPS